jgi:hypothetical protein
MAKIPAKPLASNLAQKRAKRLITILTDDHNFNVIDKIVDLYRRVCKSRIKPAEKYKLEYQILSQLLQYAYPKLQTIESDIKQGENVVFNVQVGAPAPSPSAAVVSGNKVKSVSIPTVKGTDGTFQVSLPKGK